MKAQRHILPCGATLVAEHIPYMHSATIGFWIRFGSREEPHDIQGAAHYIEHMLFKGTTKRSPQDIARDIEQVGGAINAMTGKETTCYYAKVLTEDVPLAVEILGDMFRNATFPGDEFVREKEVVLEEIKGRDDEPEDLIYDLFLEDIYGPQALGHSILGREDSIRAMTRDDLHNTWCGVYHPPGLIVAIAGNLGKHKLDRIIPEALGAAGTPAKPERHRFKPCAYSPGMFVHPRETEQTHICLGMPGVSYRHRDRYVYSLLDMMLGGGMSSRLFQEIREKRGLVYDIHTENLYFSDTGLFSINTATRPAGLFDVLRLMLEELAKLTKSGSAKEELQRVKQQLRASIAMSLESSTTRMMKAARSELYYGRPVSDTEILSLINKVSLADISRVARSIFRPDRFALTLLGPFTPREKTSIARKAKALLDSI